MRIKIQKCHGGEWYSKHIGEVFEVVELPNKNELGKFYVDIRNRRIYNTNGRRFMAVWNSDVKLIEEII